MNDLSHESPTNGAAHSPIPFGTPIPTEESYARIVVRASAWLANDQRARDAAFIFADSIDVAMSTVPDGDMRTDELAVDGEAMDRIAKELRTLGFEFEVVAESSATPPVIEPCPHPEPCALHPRVMPAFSLEDAAAKLNDAPEPQPEPVLESRVLIGRQSWLRVKEKTAAKVMTADRECNVGLSTTPTGAMMTNAFPKGDVRIVAFASALDGLKVAHVVMDLPPGEAVVEPVEEPTKKPRGSARAERRADAGDDEENDTSLDLSIAHAMGEDFAAALKIVLKAAPKRGASPAISHVVLASDPDKKRLELAAHDGCRWHLAFVPTSDVVEMIPQAIQLRSARSLLKSVEYAVKERKLGARVGLSEHTGSPTRLIISCGKPQALTFELKLAAKGEPDGWRPPRFSRSGDATAAEYDARAIAEATSWKGARVTRDECDGAGRRHITLMDQTGVELMRAVIVASGLTEGLPEEPQLEIDGALSPKKSKRGKKAEQLPLATGPGVRRAGTGSWLFQRSASGGEWTTEATGSESDIADAFASAKKKPGTGMIRTFGPDGLQVKFFEFKQTGMSKAEKAVAKPAAKKRGPKFESNVTPVGGRRPVKPTKPAKKGARAKK